jgi:predicted GIY-YIG superfamily endonuclease
MTTVQVYILHAETPLDSHNRAQHYIGFSGQLSARMHQHATGNSHSKIVCNGFHRYGIPLHLARIVEVPDRQTARALEKSWKMSYKSIRHLCPLCNPQAVSRHNGLGHFPQAIDQQCQGLTIQ